MLTDKNQREGDSVTSSSIPKLDRTALLGIMAQQSDDVLQDLMGTIAQAAIDAQFEEFIGAENYERSSERKDHRNGFRARSVDTRIGSIDLRIPRAREGSFVPPLVEHRKRSERALVAAVQEMFISGVSTRKIEKVLHELGVAQMSKSQVSVLCAELDTQVQAFRERRLELSYPYVMLDALYVSVREDGHVHKLAVVIAYGINEHGTREVIGIDVVQTESRESWLGFLRSLVARGLHGVLLVVSDAHEGLRAAITAVFGATALRQRCRVHFLRNIMAHVSQHRKLEVADGFRSILSQSTAEEARTRAVSIIEQFGKTCPKAMEILAAGLDDVLAFYAFPAVHRRKLWSSNPIEHLNGTLRKRTDVVGVFPNRKSAVRLISMVLIEQTEDWITERCYMSDDSMQLAIRNAPGYTQLA
jgi:putative transposase